MRRRSAGEAESNLDSLTDTMTNIVGFLIIAIAVTQLSVREAVKRVSTRPNAEAAAVPPDVLAAARGEEERLRKMLEALRKKWQDLAPRPVQQQTPTLEQLRQQIDALGAALKGWEAADGPTLKRKLADLEAERRRLTQAVLDARQQLDKLRENEVAVAARQPVVRLPVRRPPEPGTKPVYYLCRNGRVAVWDPVPLLEKLDAALGAAGGGGGGLDGLADAHFRLRLEQRIDARRTRPVLCAVLEPRDPMAGETLEQIRQPTSAFQQHLRAFDPAKSYGQFLVWADGFDAYVQARTTAEGLHMKGPATAFRAGWEPRDAGEPLLIPLNAEASDPKERKNTD